MPETEKEEKKMPNPQFKCDQCGSVLKKEATLKKHFVTKHEKQVCKVCNETFQISLEVWIHIAKEHSKDIMAKISVKKKYKLIENTEKNFLDDLNKAEELDSDKYKCSICKEILYKKYARKPSTDNFALL